MRGEKINKPRYYNRYWCVNSTGPGFYCNPTMGMNSGTTFYKPLSEPPAKTTKSAETSSETVKTTIKPTKQSVKLVLSKDLQSFFNELLEKKKILILITLQLNQNHQLVSLNI